MKYLILSSFIFVTTSCIATNYDTRFKIESFQIINCDTIEGTIEIKFDVKYYQSDRDTGYSSLEKGLKGSDDKILFFGFVNQNGTFLNYCKHLKFEEFINGFNNKDRAFIGQRFDFSYKFCVSSKDIKLNNVLYLILKNQDTQTIDTLRSSIWQ